MKHAGSFSLAWIGGLTALSLGLSEGCQIDSGSGMPYEGAFAGAPHEAGAGVDNGGGAFLGDDPSVGGTDQAQGQSERGGESGAAETRRAELVRSEIESCLAELIGPAHDDIVSVSGRAGALGAVEYTIAGYSAGSHDSNGLQRATNSQSGQRGTPAGIDDTGLWLSTFDGPVVVGRLYESDEDAPRRARIDFRILTDNNMTAVSCFSGGSGRFMFTQFDASTVSLDHDAPIATGGYEFQCPDADIDVRGCFRYFP